MSNPWDDLKGAPPSSSGTPKPPTPISQPISPAFSPPGRLSKSSGGRGTALILLAVGLGITIFDWYMFKSQQSYSVKLALAGPCLTIMGLVGLPFPQALEKDSTDDAAGKIARVAGISLGLAAGALNWYFLAH